jgi:hypothetical protein
MLRTFLLIIAICFCAMPLRASEEPSSDEKPGKVSRFFKIFRFGKGSEKGSQATWKKLVLNMNVEPMPIKLSETRQMKVTLQLANRTKRLVQLEFPTTQRIEVLLRSKTGKLVEQWSEDQAFANEPTLVTINPGERLEYTVNVSTRDLSAGQTYTIEGFFPNYEQLKVTKTISPD